MDLVPLDLGRRCVPYAEAWQTQREVHAAVYTLSCSTSSTVSGRRPSTTAACTSRWVCQASAYGTQRRPRSSGTRSMRARYLVDFARVVGGQRRVADRVRAGVVVAVAAEDPGLTASGGTGC